MKIKKGIIVIPMMGFANRLRFLATVRLTLGYLTDKFFIDWRDCSGFNCKFADIFQKIGDYKLTHLIDYKKSNYLYYGHILLSELIILLSKQDGVEYDYLIVTGGHNLIKEPKLIFNWIANKISFYKSIVWSESVNRKVADFVDTYDIDYTNTAAIHIRRVIDRFDGEDIKNNKSLDFNRNSPIENFKEHISQIKADKDLILFTNSEEVKKSIGDFSLNFINKPRIIIPGNNNYNRLEKDSIIHSIVEFIVMSRCKLIVGTYMSSFSDEASYMEGVPKLLVLKAIDKADRATLKQYITNYHSNNLQHIYNNLCINANSEVLLDFFTDLS